MHQTDVWVILNDPGSWRPGISKPDIIDLLEPMLVDEPGLAYNFTQPIAMRVDELTSGVKSDVAVKIFGEDMDVINDLGERIGAVIGRLPGTANSFVERTTGQPYLNIEIDRDAVADLGLNVAEVQQVIEMGIGGQVVSEVFEGQRRFDVTVRFPASLRTDFQMLLEVPIALPGGGFVPLKRVAKVVPVEGPREIARENGWRRVIVGANLEGIDIGSYVENLQQAIAREVPVPAGVFLEYGGAFENQQRAMRHLMFVVPLSLLIILGLLYTMFGGLRHAVLIFGILPFALSGGVFFLFLRSLYLSVSASIGFVALFGVAVLNGIVLVEHLNQLRKRGQPLAEAVVRGAGDRLRPVLMTAMVASLGFVPMAFNTGPGSEVQRPLATVVIGGLITSTLVTLLVLPLVYEWVERRFGSRDTSA
ncbi:MAG: efflux RND transporter permease subunit [Candidatus Krumholzibacteriia bacterium]